MLVGGALGILFVTLLRRVMVEDPELPFPESVAASELHKAGQQGSKAAKLLFYNMGFGGLVYLLGQFQLFNSSKNFIVNVGQMGRSMLRLGTSQTAQTVSVGGVTTFQAPAISPAYLGVGYIIGPRLAALNFAGGVVSWGLLVPLIIYILGPQLQTSLPAGSAGDLPRNVWFFIARPIAVGGMMVGAAWTLFRMRKSLGLGMKRAISDLKKSAAAHAATNRTERDLNGKVVFGGLFVAFLCMVLLYTYFSGMLRGGIVATLVMAVTGFFFAAVSGNLVGMIGSSNNPVSGLTLSTLIIAALLMVSIGVKGMSGVAAVLGVAAVVCVSSAVAGEMLQDLKVGHILGGTPWRMQVGDILGILFASALLYFPLLVLHQGNINAGGQGFGDRQLSAPQAGLMAALSQGIVGGEMPWPLVVVGIFFGIAMIMTQVRSHMFVAVGMYLPFETTFAIFIGGVFRSLGDWLAKRRGFNEAQMTRVDNAGVLTASGLIAGEAVLGLVWASLQFAPKWTRPQIFSEPSYLFGGMIVMFLLAVLMIGLPLTAAGDPSEPAPPTAIM